MAIYDLGTETVTRSAFEELEWDLSRAIGHDYTMAHVMTADLAEILNLFRDTHHYLRLQASNDHEANELLKRFEGRQ